MESSELPKSRPLSVVALALMASAIGAATGGGLCWYYFTAQSDAASVRPPVAIVDFSKLVIRADGAQRSADDLNAQMVRVKKAIEKLRSAGFLVIDSQSVLGAPESLYVPMDRLE